jgi:hypothetical protein
MSSTVVLQRGFHSIQPTDAMRAEVRDLLTDGLRGNEWLAVYTDADGYLFPIRVFAASRMGAETEAQQHAHYFCDAGNWNPTGVLACLFVGRDANDADAWSTREER